MDEKLLSRISDFISENQGIKRNRILAESRIEKDLGITGDDAIEMLIAFGKEFNVDVKHFMAADYFNAEGASRLFCTYDPNKKILTVWHLLKAIMTHKLDESVISD